MVTSRRSLLALVVLVAAIGLSSSQALTSAQKAAIDRTVRQLMRCANIPALSLSYVSLEPGIVYNQGYGTSNPRMQKAVGQRSVFCLGGATQAFTAVLLAKLIDENQNVTWDTPVQDLVAHRIVLPDRYRSDKLNLKDILAMRSGLAGMDIVSVAKPYDVERLRRKLRYVPEVSGFREDFVYNEILFSLVEEVVEALGGDSWYNLIKQHIINPIGMTDTTFIGTFKDRGDVDFVKGVVLFNGQPYVLADDAYDGLELVGPASTLCTSAYDMSLWMRFLLYNGQTSGGQLVRQEALRETYKALQPRTSSGEPELEGYKQPDIQTSYTRSHNALGWISGDYRGFSFVSQDGSLPGYQSLATIFPDQNIAVFTAFTGDKSAQGFAAKVLINILGAEILMRGNAWLAENTACSVMDSLAKLHRPKADDANRGTYRAPGGQHRPLEDYEGLYRNFAFGDVQVSYNETLQMKYGMGVYKLETTNVNNTFQLLAEGGNLWYSTNADYFRDNGRMFATFAADPRDPEERVNEVTISGFDSNIKPVFGINPRAPEYEESTDYDRCSASTSLVSVWMVIFLLVCGYLYQR